VRIEKKKNKKIIIKNEILIDLKWRNNKYYNY